MATKEEHPNYEEKDAFTIYMGALSCMRHRGEEFYELQQQGRLAYLILNEIDYITGDYINKLKDAVRLAKAKHDPKVINVAAGCQGTLLSTDYDMLRSELEAELGIKVLFDKNCHLLGFNGHNKGQGHGGGDDRRFDRDERGGSRRYGGRGGHDRREHGGEEERRYGRGGYDRREHGSGEYGREHGGRGGRRER